MTPVILESPYGAKTAEETSRNIRYARACMRDCLLRGEAPYASHLLYTQPGVLDDDDPSEREHGIDAGFVWRLVAVRTVVYTDLGRSTGMAHGIAHALAHGISVKYRTLGDDWDLVATESYARRPSKGWG